MDAPLFGLSGLIRDHESSSVPAGYEYSFRWYDLHGWEDLNLGLGTTLD